MKKVLSHPLVIITSLGIVFMLGVLAGRHTTYSVTQLVENDGSITLEEVDPIQTDEIITSPLKGKININTADLKTICLLPGIGEVLAQRIIDYRKANGPFKSVGELTNVEGFGEKRVNDLTPYITTGYLTE